MRAAKVERELGKSVAMNSSIGEEFFLPGSLLRNRLLAMMHAVRDLLQVHGAMYKSQIAMKDPIGEIFLFAPGSREGSVLKRARVDAHGP